MGRSHSRFGKADDSPGFMLWRATALWHKAIRTALEPFHLTQPQFVLLFSCKWLNQTTGANGVTQVQLAQHAQMDVNVTSQVLRTLERKELITRRRHPTDSRANVIVLTVLGNQVASDAVQAVEEVDRTFFSVLGDDVRNLNQLLARLAQSRF